VTLGPTYPKISAVRNVITSPRRPEKNRSTIPIRNTGIYVSVDAKSLSSLVRSSIKYYQKRSVSEKQMSDLKSPKYKIALNQNFKWFRTLLTFSSSEDFSTPSKFFGRRR
jgi:hypothetical protein